MKREGERERTIDGCSFTSMRWEVMGVQISSIRCKLAVPVSSNDVIANRLGSCASHDEAFIIHCTKLKFRKIHIKMSCLLWDSNSSL